MHVLITLAPILGLLVIAALGLSNVERELLRPPPRSLRNDCEDEES
jgi:hypothetical protein